MRRGGSPHQEAPQAPTPLALAYTSSCWGQVMVALPRSPFAPSPGRCVQAFAHACTHALRAHTRVQRCTRTHSQGELRLSTPLVAGRWLILRTGALDRPQDPVCRRHVQPTTQAEGQGPFCPPAGAGVTRVSTRKRAPSGCCPCPGRQGVSFSDSWGLRLGPWPLGAVGSPLPSTGPFETPGVGGSCLVSGQGWPQPSKGLWSGASHTTGPRTGQQAQSLGPTGLVTLEGAAPGGPCPCP